MNEIFIIQKRPLQSGPSGFYYRIVNTRTGEMEMLNFLNLFAAESHCKRLNELAAYENSLSASTPQCL